MNRMTAGGRITGIAATLAIVGFFLPWVVVSCNNTPVLEMTGYEIAQGGVLTNTLGGQTEPLPGRPMIFATVGAAGCALLVSLVAYTLGRMGVLASLLQILLGSAGIVPILLTLQGLRNEYTIRDSLGHLDLATQYGFWITIGGLIGIASGGLLNILGVIRERRPPFRDDIPTRDIVAQIEKLDEMYRREAITEEEYRAAKRKLLL